jgi:hypothetical protein
MQRQIEAAESQGAITGTTLGAISTSGMADSMLGETQNAVRIYDAYFGKLPYNRIAMTQQPALALVRLGQPLSTCLTWPL